MEVITIKHIILDSLKAELMVMDLSKNKPNYADLARKYGLDYRTVKKYHEGYKGKPKSRDKPSKLDKYKEEIIQKLSIKRTSKNGVYKFLVNKYGIDSIGSYSNFKTYCRNNKLTTSKDDTVAPRYETDPGDMAQVDWKEGVILYNRDGKKYIVNIFHLLLKFSRFSYLELTLSKEQPTVIRCIVNAFKRFGGIPKRLLFDNMSTVADVNGRTKKVNSKIVQFSKDFNFDVQLCKARHAKTKGSNEARNKILDRIRVYDKEFDTFEDLIKIVERINEEMNIDVCQGTNMPPYLLFYKEKEYLNPLPCESIVDSYLAPTKVQVNKSQLITYKGQEYSLDDSLVDKFVQPEEFNGVLYLYYKGKCVQTHQIKNSSPINYLPKHYKQVMSKTTSSDKIDEYVARNLQIMDKLMETRKVNITKETAIKSVDNLIAYLIQISNNNGWITSFLSSLNKDEKKILLEQMRGLLPYIKNENLFISSFKFVFKSYKVNECKLGYYLIEESVGSFISDEGNKIIFKEYEKEIIDFYEQRKKEELEHLKEISGNEQSIEPIE